MCASQRSSRARERRSRPVSVPRYLSEFSSSSICISSTVLCYRYVRVPVPGTRNIIHDCPVPMRYLGPGTICAGPHPSASAISHVVVRRQSTNPLKKKNQSLLRAAGGARPGGGEKSLQGTGTDAAIFSDAHAVVLLMMTASAPPDRCHVIITHESTIYTLMWTNKVLNAAVKIPLYEDHLVRRLTTERPTEDRRWTDAVDGRSGSDFRSSCMLQRVTDQQRPAQSNSTSNICVPTS